jgi:uncharacterized membrane protein
LLQLRRAVPVDVVVGIGLTAGAVLLVQFVQMGVLLQTVVVVPSLLGIPGYLVLAVLFPRGAHATRRADRQLDYVERLILAYGVSLAILPALALLLTLLSITLTAETILLSILGLVVVLAPLVVVRRQTVPAQERYELPSITSVLSIPSWPGEHRRTTVAVNGLLTLSIAVGLTLTVGVILAPPQDGAYTEAAVLTENDSGELVAANYPDTIDGVSDPLTVRLANQEGHSVTYTVVVELQRLNSSNESASVRDRERLTRFTPELADGATWTNRHRLDPEMTGEDLRVVYYIYRGEAPSTPTSESAHETLYFWTDVSA